MNEFFTETQKFGLRNCLAAIGFVLLAVICVPLILPLEIWREWKNKKEQNKDRRKSD